MTINPSKDTMLRCMDIVQHRRTACWIERGVLFLSLCYICFHVMPRAWTALVTDFPDYYMSARLAHEHYDTSRMYEWTWIQREKDQHDVDIRVIGMIPITPFSTLALWPLTDLAPLTAKHIWILLSLVLLVPIGWMLRSMTHLSYQRIALAFSLSIPLYRNLQFGQFYVLLLLLIVAACWAYLREYYVLAGALVAVAAACKIFPILFFVFFLQRRSWRALASGVVTGLATVAVSVVIFGWSPHRTYLHEILPWTLHGEGMSPYVTSSASISSVLHYLFLAEPQWNPHPWHSSPLWYALLQPTLQMLVLAPAVLLIRRNDRTQHRILLEWSALLTASLAISTMPASYHFVLMVLPICVLAARLVERKWYWWLAVLLVLYLGIGFPMPGPSRIMGLAILLYVPRLFLMLALLLGIYVLLWPEHPTKESSWDWTQYAWMAAMFASVAISVPSTLHLQRAVRQEYAYRLPLKTQALLEANPRLLGGATSYIAFTLSGYHLVTANLNSTWVDPSSDDDLSFTGGAGHIWVERSSSPYSGIVDMQDPAHVVLKDAHDPMLSADGLSLGFIRNDHGFGRLMARRISLPESAIETALTPPSLNVYEATFLSEKEYAFSAVEGRHPPQIFLTDAAHSNTPLPLGESRYPALSPDGHWMAYSHFEFGAWNLWIRDQRTGVTRRIADEPCNQIQPSWETDSKTLLYSTDCGRSLWLTAVARRRVLP
jgi:hypothetical protein